MKTRDHEDDEEEDVGEEEAGEESADVGEGVEGDDDGGEVEEGRALLVLGHTLTQPADTSPQEHLPRGIGYIL